ncbi:MAG: glycoside hydrolase family 2 protein [Eubacterium sp.]
MKKISLNGKWILKNCSNLKEYPADVPGSDFGALIKSGEIKNPLISGSGAEGLKTAENDYEFTRRFDIDKEDLSFNAVHLVCGCLDTICTCYINGKEAFKSANAFIPVDKDIKQYLKQGENTITIHFYSAYKYIQKKQNEKPLPKNNNGVDGIPYIRKPACHFGWDWGPCVPYCGIISDIGLELFNNRIENIRISQNTTKEKAVVSVCADNAQSCYIITPNGEKLYPKDNVFTVENPQLWYTRELSGREVQPLYTVVFENNDDKAERKIGLRSLYLDREKDEYGENFCFVLNGERIFAKGANVIPFSAIPEDCSKETVDYYLDLAQSSHFNILRIWGGGSYADDYILSQCDERGILLWQDFCFACQMYPLYDSDFLSNVLEEVRVNVLRMNTHPCLALWCGNNEIEAMFSYLPRGIEIVKAYKEFFYKTLPDYISGLTQVCYIPTSPVGKDCFKDNTADDDGDTHMWNVWHGLKKLDYYQKRYSRFLSEFGLESLPSMKAIKTFADKSEYSITSDSFNRHQKCVGGNEKMLFYLTEMFNQPKEFEYLPYLTGIVQSECIKNATVHFRQNKGRCNGSVFWQFNDVWNCPSWSSVDFEGVPKALQYNAKEFFAPVTVTCKKEKGRAEIFAHNDTLMPVKLMLHLELRSFDCAVIAEKQYSISLKPNSFERVTTVTPPKNSFIRLSFNDTVITEILDAPSRLPLKRANITASLEGNKLKLTSDNFAYSVCIEADEPPKDNYFSLLKGESRTVEFENPPKEYKIICANNIDYKNEKIKKPLFRFFYRLKPLNIANYFYYTFN